jgi:hypothetical protein
MMCAVAVLAVLAVPVTIALAAFSVLSWQPAMVAAGLMVLVLAGLRLRARSARRKGRRRETRFPRASADGAMVESDLAQESSTQEASAPAADAGKPSDQATVARAGGARDVAFDLAAFDTRAESAESAPRPGEWTPRPVPTPSYLSKPSLPAPSQGGQLLDARPTEDPFADLLTDGGSGSGDDQRPADQHPVSERHPVSDQRPGGAQAV